MSRRQTRSQTKATNTSTTLSDLETFASGRPSIDLPANNGVSQLPMTLTRAITCLKANDHKNLLRKQTWLRQYSLEVPNQFTRHVGVLDATLVFAQEEAGTAVCIAPNGIILTCSHCIAESLDEKDRLKGHWLLFRSGVAVKAICVAWDERRDLALLRVDAAQREGEDSGPSRFPFISISPTAPALDSRLVCVGHPGSEDLEASQPGTKTNYDVLHVSTGRYRGCADDQDPQVNSDIGALMHDCWTYWGHSGAPLLDFKTGKLVGLHSSWDDQTGMRRGIPLEAILEFLDENKDYTLFMIE